MNTGFFTTRSFRKKSYYEKNGFVDHVPGIMLSKSQEKGTPSIVGDRKPQPRRTRQTHRKARTTKIKWLQQNNSRKLHHVFVTENDFFLKCATSVSNLEASDPFALKRNSEIHLYSAPRRASPPHPLLSIATTRPPYFTTTTFIPVGPISRYSRPNESWSADGSSQS